MKCGGILIPPSQLGSEDFSTFYNGGPQHCQYKFGNVRTLNNIHFRVIYTDLTGNCSEGKIEVYDGLGDAKRKLTTICSAKDAEKAILVRNYFMTVVYDVKIPGLRGFRAVARDKCDRGFMPSRSGQYCEGDGSLHAHK